MTGIQYIHIWSWIQNISLYKLKAAIFILTLKTWKSGHIFQRLNICSILLWMQVFRVLSSRTIHEWRRDQNLYVQFFRRFRIKWQFRISSKKVLKAFLHSSFIISSDWFRRIFTTSFFSFRDTEGAPFL